MANLVLPRVQAMVLCDGAREDEQEPRVYRLDGVRASMGVTSFPALCPRLSVFLQMSGHPGTIACQVEIENAETGDIVITTPKKSMTFTGPLDVVPVVFRIRNCVFPSAG